MHQSRITLLTLVGIARLGEASALECGPVTIDLGVVAQGRRLAVERTCRNTSAREIQIQEIHTGCTCLTAKTDRNTLAPGAKTKLRLEIETSPLADRIEFAVEIPYRGKESGAEILMVAADVRPSVVTFPEYLDMGDFRKSGARQVLIVDTTGRSFTIHQATTSRSEIDIRWVPVELVRMGDRWEPALRGGAVTGYQLTVQIKPGSLRHSLSDEVQLELGHELQKTLRIRVVGYSP